MRGLSPGEKRKLFLTKDVTVGACRGAARATGSMERPGRGWWALTKRGRRGGGSNSSLTAAPGKRCRWGCTFPLKAGEIAALAARRGGRRVPGALRLGRGVRGMGARRCLSRAAGERVPAETAWKLPASCSGL